MRQSSFCFAAVLALVLAIFQNGLAQSVFRVGAWCLHQPAPALQAIYFNTTVGEWRVKGGERDKLLNLGLNYFIACSYGLNAEDALVFMGDSLDAAPVRKEFESTLEIVQPGGPYFPPGHTYDFYQVWRRSRTAELYPSDMAWVNSVVVGYDSMYARHAARLDGVHSFIIGHEGGIRQNQKIAGINFMGDNTNVDSFILPNYYAQTGDTLSPYQFAKRVVRADHFTGGGYYLTNTTPYTGPLFQAQIDTFVASLRHSARGIRDTTSATKLWMLVQTQYGSNDLRLPTKDEVLCQVNLALAHGVKGIIYYLYSSYVIHPPPPLPPTYEIGLLDTTTRTPTAQYTNVQDINTNYQGTGQSLVNIGSNFLNLTWKEDFTIHQNTNEPISSTYKLYDVTAKIPGGATDAEAETYVEAGVLQNGSTNHYMVVNRRCTSTETREITMTFQSTSANAYLITDVFTGDQKRFLPANAATITYTFTLGPGQGKLLKLEDLGNWSGTISSNTTWSGTVCVNNSITVSNNAMLTIQPGTTVAFADGKSLTVNAGAKIIADGTSQQTIKFTSNSHPPARAKWGGITLYSTGNVFDDCTFEYGNWVVRFVNSGGTISNSVFHTNTQALRLDYANVTVSNCEIYNNATGAVLGGQSSNSNSATFLNCHIYESDRSGIVAGTWAHAVVRNGHIEKNGKIPAGNDYQGVYVLNNSDLTFYDPDVEVIPSLGLNTIRNNQGAGVYSSNSTINLGIGSNFNTRRGDNAVFGNGILAGMYNGKQIYNAAGATVNARWTYWGQGQCPPPSSFFFGSVDRANCLTTSPTGFSKIMAGSDSTFDAKTLLTQLKSYLLDRSGVPSGFDSLSTYDALALYFSMIRNDYQDLLQERAQADSVLQYVYDTHKGSAAGDKAFQSLVGYEMIYGDWSQAEILCEQALLDLTKASHADMLGTLIGLELKLGKFTEAQQHFDDYALAYPQEETAIQMLKESFETAEEDYENGWKNGLNKFVASSPHSSGEPQTLPTNFYLTQNFPNPFSANGTFGNPETQIKFHLEREQRVRLRIFDVSGRLVRRLGERVYGPGEHVVNWNGRDEEGVTVASGIYFYELLAGEQSLRRRMALVH